MIAEDYVSFETAKLLKEKGFDWEESPFYTEQDRDEWRQQNSYTIPNPDYNPDIPFDCETQTMVVPHVSLQMAMKWLREVHHIVIVIQPLSFNGAKDCLCDNWTYSVWVDYNLKIGESLRNVNGYYSTYEEACEAAIKFGMFFVDNKNGI